uniref:Uncharacterized protein n=1 Tax=Knipowitschia caucasica TaxID=637954 RepID=A0AAV2MJ51_KNICA
MTPLYFDNLKGADDRSTKPSHRRVIPGVAPPEGNSSAPGEARLSAQEGPLLPSSTANNRTRPRQPTEPSSKIGCSSPTMPQKPGPKPTPEQQTPQAPGQQTQPHQRPQHRRRSTPQEDPNQPGEWAKLKV